MRRLKRMGVAAATFGFSTVPLACGDDDGAGQPYMRDAATEEDAGETVVVPVDTTDDSSPIPSDVTSGSAQTDAGSPTTGNLDGGTGAATEATDAAADTAPMMDGSTSDAMATGESMDPQVPPTEAVAMQAWLAAGYYLDWVCEEEPNAKTEGAEAIHVHGARTRVCANVMLASSPAPGGDGEFPAGAAAVKEVYDEDDALIATVVSVKTAAESDNGNNWYWYGGPEAEGYGFAGCTGCHSAAASDEDHPGAGDFVYFQVTDEAQLPPVGDVASVQAWLEAGHYLDWTCEEAANVKTDGAAAIHVHPKNRICVNAKLAAGELTADGQWPAGVAAVKELYGEQADGGTMTGAVLYTKVSSKSDEGNGFFWFAGEGATGLGVAGCTGCHSAAGADTDHPGAGDYVYDRVVQ